MDTTCNAHDHLLGYLGILGIGVFGASHLGISRYQRKWYPPCLECCSKSSVTFQMDHLDVSRDSTPSAYLCMQPAADRLLDGTCIMCYMCVYTRVYVSCSISLATGIIPRCIMVCIMCAVHVSCAVPLTVQRTIGWMVCVSPTSSQEMMHVFRAQTTCASTHTLSLPAGTSW